MEGQRTKDKGCVSGGLIECDDDFEKMVQSRNLIAVDGRMCGSWLIESDR